LPANPVSTSGGYGLGIKPVHRTAEKPLAMTLPTEFDHRDLGLAVLEALDPNEELNGYELEDALVIARAEHVDLDLANALVAEHGCSSRLAVRILL
jgi:hypothetical protein